jgi:hypothetical protein
LENYCSEIRMRNLEKKKIYSYQKILEKF